MSITKRTGLILVGAEMPQPVTECPVDRGAHAVSVEVADALPVLSAQCALLAKQKANIIAIGNTIKEGAKYGRK